MNIRNSSSQTAIECAKSNNHLSLVQEVEKLESKQPEIVRKSISLADDLHADLTDCSNLMLTFHSDPMSLLTGSDNVMLSPAAISPASSIISVASTSKSHDGVFLRPGAVTRSESQKYKTLSLDLHSPLLGERNGQSPRGDHPEKGHKLVKRPSVDSGINMTSGHSSDSLPSLRYRTRIGNREKLSR